MKVEVHGHLVVPEMMGAAGKYGPEFVKGPDGNAELRIGPYGAKIGQSYDEFIAARKEADEGGPAHRLQWMDERGIDKMIHTISPLWYLYWAEPEIAIPFAQLNNDLLAKYCAESDRLSFAATLPMQDLEASVEEAKRAAELGAKAVNIGTDDFGGRNFDDEVYWPLYSTLVENNLPIFVHPYPLPMAEGYEDRYNLSWVVGYIYQETVAFSHLTLGGVFDDFPDLRVYITHGGGMVPYQFGRIEAARTTKQPGVKAKRPLREYLEQNFVFDIHVHELPARRLLVDFMGPERLVVGSNAGGWDHADGFGMLDELNLSPEDHERIAGTNAVEFFNLR